MKYFFLKIAQKYALWTVFIWSVFLLCDLLIFRMLDLQSGMMTSIFGFIGASLVSATLVNIQQWIAFWRRVSENIRQFWSLVFAALLFNLIINALCFFLSRLLFRQQDFSTEFFHVSLIDFLWISFLALSGSFTTLFDRKRMLENQTLKPAKQIGMLFAVYAFVIVLIPLFLYSRLLAYILIEVTMMIWFFMTNSFASASIRREVRWKCMFVGLTAVLLLAFITYQIENKKFPESSTLLGRIGPQKVWAADELDKLERPNQWMDWYLSAKLLSAEQTAKAFEKLAVICPPMPTDHPTFIICLDKTSIDQNLSLTEINDESEILKWLNSPSVYLRLAGLLVARAKDELSPQLQTKIEEIRNSAGRLSSVAEKTLADHKRGTCPFIRLVIKNESQF